MVAQTDDELAARAALEAQLPSTYLDLPFREYRVEELGNGIWEAAVSYGPTPPRGSQTNQFAPGLTQVTSFEIGTQTAHRTQSICTRAMYAGAGAPNGVTRVNILNPGANYTTAPTVTFSGGGGSGAAATGVIQNGIVVGVQITDSGTGYTSAPSVTFSGAGGLATAIGTAEIGPVAPNCLGAIGVNGETIEGVDVDVPVYTWTETWYVPPTQITQEYQNGVMAVMAAPVNAFPFRGRLAGEVRILGVSGSLRDANNYELTFKFSAIPNAVIPVPGITQPVVKFGWDYVWIRYVDNTDPRTNSWIKVPQGAYVEQVYYGSDFSLLGIGS